MALYHCYSTAYLKDTGNLLALDAANNIESAVIMWGSESSAAAHLFLAGLPLAALLQASPGYGAAEYEMTNTQESCSRSAELIIAL